MMSDAMTSSNPSQTQYQQSFFPKIGKNGRATRNVDRAIQHRSLQQLHKASQLRDSGSEFESSRPKFRPKVTQIVEHCDFKQTPKNQGNQSNKSQSNNLLSPGMAGKRKGSTGSAFSS